MTDLPAVFAELHTYQPGATELLSAALAADRVSHAYLFVGTPGALITETAHAFAAALVCENGGCGTCDACRRVQRGSHPDVTELVPEGARAYLVEQIREVVAAAQYAPSWGRRRIFILNRADLMNQAAANAFLKTLEEPSPEVVFILIAPNETAVLPTILSRCQVVRFRTIPAAEGRVLVARRTGVDPQRAAFALAACEGSVTEAIAFAGQPAAWQLRSQVLSCLGNLHRMDPWAAISAGRAFAANWMAPVEALKSAQEDARDRESEFLDKQAQKALADKNKRALTAATGQAFGRITSLVRSWLADVLAVREGMPERMVNTDAAEGITRAAGAVQDGGIRAAVEATQRAERNIAYNVGAQNAIDALVLEVRRALYGSA